MNVRLKFLGAAQTVTGSKYLLDIDGQKKILIDCGLFQGLKELRLRNWDKLPIDPKEIDFVLLTHAHIDHIGYLPRLVKDGYSNKIICTTATADLAKIMLKDAAKLQEEEAIFAFKKGYSRHSKPEPLFTTEDAEQTISQFEGKSMNSWINLDHNISIRYQNAGHILGAAILEVRLTGSNQAKKIVFSGDLGRYNDPIMIDPVEIDETDILLVESTYGDRVNPMTNVEQDLIKVVQEAISLNGPIIIPAFAVGRTQAMLYYFDTLMASGAIPSVPIYIDSPMAISVTGLYEKHGDLHKLKVEKNENGYKSIFDSPNIHFCYTQESSQALNDINKPCIIISASGMATGGRILHHMYHRLPKTTNTFLFVGYQAEGTRGRDMLEGASSIKIFGEEVPVRCNVRSVSGLSAHADQTELLRWLSGFKKSPKYTFITHGETKSANTFAKTINEKLGWQTLVPEYLETFSIFEGI